MALEYVNRKGDVYYLQQGKTRTGKPQYYFSRKLTGSPRESLPEGYEVYEKPESAQVYARKARPTEISSFERQIVEDGIRRLAGLKHAIVELEPRALVVYLPGRKQKAVDDLLDVLGVPPRRREECAGWLARQDVYQKIIRFTLADAEQRLYRVERWCFLGSIDNWLPLLGTPMPLDQAVERYAPHLGKQSFYGLM